MTRISVLCLCLFVAASCATTFPGKVSQMSLSASALRKGAGIYLDAKCEKISLECPKGPGMADKCVPWVQCKDMRADIYATANAVQLLLDLALVTYSLSGEKDAGVIFGQAIKELGKLKAKIEQHNLLEVLR